jgi:hypothetical protein
MMRTDMTPDAAAAYLRARRVLLEEGASPHNLVITPSDLNRFGLSPWTGMVFGMRCGESTIVVAGR